MIGMSKFNIQGNYHHNVRKQNLWMTGHPYPPVLVEEMIDPLEELELLLQLRPRASAGSNFRGTSWDPRSSPVPEYSPGSNVAIMRDGNILDTTFFARTTVKIFPVRHVLLPCTHLPHFICNVAPVRHHHNRRRLTHLIKGPHC
jgi:hypothetical protein